MVTLVCGGGGGGGGGGAPPMVVSHSNPSLEGGEGGQNGEIHRTCSKRCGWATRQRHGHEVGFVLPYVRNHEIALDTLQYLFQHRITNTTTPASPRSSESFSLLSLNTAGLVKRQSSNLTSSQLKALKHAFTWAGANLYFQFFFWLTCLRALLTANNRQRTTASHGRRCFDKAVLAQVPGGGGGRGAGVSESPGAQEFQEDHRVDVLAPHEHHPRHSSPGAAVLRQQWVWVGRASPLIRVRARAPGGSPNRRNISCGQGTGPLMPLPQGRAARQPMPHNDTCAGGGGQGLTDAPRGGDSGRRP